MSKLLMISGDRALAEGKHGAFYNTLEEFNKHWERIDVICPRVRNQQTKEVFGNVFIHPSPWPLIFQSLWVLKMGRRLYKQNKFDLINVHEFPPFYNGIGARMLWNKIKIPYILEIFHIPGHPRSSGIKEVIYKFLFKLFIKVDSSKAKAVRVMNQDQVPDFLIKAGISKDKIVHVPAIYIDLEIFKPMALSKKYDLIFVGRLESNKGINLFLETVGKLGCTAVMVGDGSLLKKIKQEIENRGLKIKMHGYAKDSHEIARLLNESKVLMTPSYNEGGPRVVVEALACGVPVLATPVGIVPDLLKNSSGGEMVAWDAEDIAKKAGMLLSDSNRYDKLSAEAIEMAKQFEKKSAIKNYADKLQALI